MKKQLFKKRKVHDYLVAERSGSISYSTGDNTLSIFIWY